MECVGCGVCVGVWGCGVCVGVWSVCVGCGVCEGYQLYDRLDGIAGYFRGTKCSRFSRIDPETGRLVKKLN